MWGMNDQSSLSGVLIITNSCQLMKISCSWFFFHKSNFYLADIISFTNLYSSIISSSYFHALMVNINKHKFKDCNIFTYTVQCCIGKVQEYVEWAFLHCLAPVLHHQNFFFFCKQLLGWPAHSNTSTTMLSNISENAADPNLRKPNMSCIESFFLCIPTKFCLNIIKQTSHFSCINIRLWGISFLDRSSILSSTLP